MVKDQEEVVGMKTFDFKSFFPLSNTAGYTRDTSFLEMVVDIVQELKRANPNLVYGEFYTLFDPRLTMLYWITAFYT